MDKAFNILVNIKIAQQIMVLKILWNKLRKGIEENKLLGVRREHISGALPVFPVKGM